MADGANQDENTKNNSTRTANKNKNKSNSSTSLLSNALGSASASIVSRVFTHPLDTAKARLQAPLTTSLPSTSTATTTKSTNLQTFRGPISALRQVYVTEGLVGLYRGFGAIVVGGTPGTVIYLCSYEWFKYHLTPSTSSEVSVSTWQNFGTHFFSGLLAETVACLVYVPVDVVKERLQVQSLGLTPASTCTSTTSRANDVTNTKTKPNQMYHGSWDAFSKIVKTEGFSRIYKGYAATLASFGPFSAFYFVFYETFKDWAWSPDLQKNENGTEVLSLPRLIACSSSAGALASWLTSPLDMAKLRLQVQRGQLQSQVCQANSSSTWVPYRSMADCLRRSYLEAGVRGLFRGAGARVLHFVPATTITMTSYETCRLWFSNVL